MTTGLRQVLTILLLLLFSSEQVFATSVETGSEKNAGGWYVAQQEGLLSVDLLAEENETRGDKFDTIADALHERGFTTSGIASVCVREYRRSSLIFVDSGTLPRYKFFCSFLI